MMNIEGLRGAAKVAAQGARRRAEAVGEAQDAAVEAMETAWLAAVAAGPGELGAAGLAFYRAHAYYSDRFLELMALPSWHHPEVRRPSNTPSAQSVGIWTSCGGRLQLCIVRGSGSGHQYARSMTREALDNLAIPVPATLSEGSGDTAMSEQDWLALAGLGV